MLSSEFPKHYIYLQRHYNRTMYVFPTVFEFSVAFELFNGL